MIEIEGVNPKRPKLKPEHLEDVQLEIVDASLDESPTIHAWFKWPLTLCISGQAGVPSGVRPLVNEPLTGSLTADTRRLTAALLSVDFTVTVNR